jgi:hypothetical protein
MVRRVPAAAEEREARTDRLLGLLLAWVLGLGLFLVARESLGPTPSELLGLFPAAAAVLCSSVVAQALAGSRWRLRDRGLLEEPPRTWPESPRLRLLADLAFVGLGLAGVVELLNGALPMGAGLVGTLILYLLSRLRMAREWP